ncbi:MAG: peptidase MA family metallohydrolase, partial [Chloroflexi bacterium]|nr:peptidase MA family metallohydrolase [Chloroflexota bacterium]
MSVTRVAGVALRARALPLLAVVLAAVFGAALIAPAPALAGEIEVERFATRTDDPRALTFTARVRAPAGLASARLEYSVLNPDGNVGGGGEAQGGEGREQDLVFTLETITSQRYIPVGSEFTYQWTIVDREGAELVTEPQRFVFLDGRYSWQERTQGPATVYWYGPSDASANLALEATANSLRETEELLRATVPYPVKVIVWRSESEGELAMRSRGGIFDATVITGGQRVAPDLLFVFQASRDVIRHEAAHIVTKVAGDGPFTQVPSWLDEGTAVYMQPEPGFGYNAALLGGIRGDRTLSLRGLNSPPGDPGRVDLFYGQSWSVVSYLIDIYGEPAFAELYSTVKAGNLIDDALEAVYGFDQDGLYNEWRAENGLAPIDVAARPGTSAPPVIEATVPPLSIPGSSPAGGAATPATPAPDGATSWTAPAATPTLVAADSEG